MFLFQRGQYGSTHQPPPWTPGCSSACPLHPKTQLPNGAALLPGHTSHRCSRCYPQAPVETSGTRCSRNSKRPACSLGALSGWWHQSQRVLTPQGTRRTWLSVRWSPLLEIPAEGLWPGVGGPSGEATVPQCLSGLQQLSTLAAAWSPPHTQAMGLGHAGTPSGTPHAPRKPHAPLSTGNWSSWREGAAVPPTIPTHSPGVPGASHSPRAKQLLPPVPPSASHSLTWLHIESGLGSPASDWNVTGQGCCSIIKR